MRPSFSFFLKGFFSDLFPKTKTTDRGRKMNEKDYIGSLFGGKYDSDDPDIVVCLCTDKTLFLLDVVKVKVPNSKKNKTTDPETNPKQKSAETVEGNGCPAATATLDDDDDQNSGRHDGDNDTAAAAAAAAREERVKDELENDRWILLERAIGGATHSAVLKNDLLGTIFYARIGTAAENHSPFPYLTYAPFHGLLLGALDVDISVPNPLVERLLFGALDWPADDSHLDYTYVVFDYDYFHTCCLKISVAGAVNSLTGAAASILQAAERIATAVAPARAPPHPLGRYSSYFHPPTTTPSVAALDRSSSSSARSAHCLVPVPHFEYMFKQIDGSSPLEVETLFEIALLRHPADAATATATAAAAASVGSNSVTMAHSNNNQTQAQDQHQREEEDLVVLVPDSNENSRCNETNTTTQHGDQIETIDETEDEGETTIDFDDASTVLLPEDNHGNDPSNTADNVSNAGRSSSILSSVHIFEDADSRDAFFNFNDLDRFCSSTPPPSVYESAVSQSSNDRFCDQLASPEHFAINLALSDDESNDADPL